MMNESLTLAEIRERFDSEWVLLEDPEMDNDLQIRSGRVLSHSKNRDEVYSKARELLPQHSAILYTGSLPEGTVVVL